MVSFLDWQLEGSCVDGQIIEHFYVGAPPDRPDKVGAVQVPHRPEFHLVRALIDTGATISGIMPRWWQTLALRSRSAELIVTARGSESSAVSYVSLALPQSGSEPFGLETMFKVIRLAEPPQPNLAIGEYLEPKFDLIVGMNVLQEFELTLRQASQYKLSYKPTTR